MALDLARLRNLARNYMVETAAVYRPDYAGSAAATLIATVDARVTRYAGGLSGDVLDLTGEATHLIHLPYGTDARPGDELLVNGSHRYLVMPTNDGRSFAFDLQVAARREA